jgi:hypothetical protein
MPDSATSSDRDAGVPDKHVGGPEAVQKASEAFAPAGGGAPSGTAVTEIVPCPGEQVVRRCGRFTLTRDAQGFWWVLTSRSGSLWYWHAEAKQWVVGCHPHRTEEEATAGLNETLAHEQAGDLDEQHAAPPTGGDLRKA